MSLLDANAESLRETALNSSAPPPKPADPGVFQNFIPGAGNYFMRGMAESGRALSMAGAAVPVLADKLIGSDNRVESFGDRYFRWHDETFGRAVDYWTPKPGEVGAAGQVVGSLAAGLTQFLANPALLVGTAQLSTAEDLVRQGVDAGAANVAGDVAALSTLAGIALPIFGKTLAGKIATGAAGNLATNVPQAAITRAVVQAAGAPEVAAQFDPLDPRARTVDLLMGVAFGAKSHIDARAAAKTQAFLEGGIPSKRTAIADAAAQAFESPLTATQRDAIMVMNAARHMDEAALPWKAGEAEHTAAVDNVRMAVEQISRGQEVDVPPLVLRETGFPALHDVPTVGSGVRDFGGVSGILRGSRFESEFAEIADVPVRLNYDLHSLGATRIRDLTPAQVDAGMPRVSAIEFNPAHIKAQADLLGVPFEQEMTGVIAHELAHAQRVALGRDVTSEGGIATAERAAERFQDHARAELAKSIAESAPKSAEPVAAPKMRGVSDRPQVARIITGPDGKITLAMDAPEIAAADKDAYRKALAASDGPAALDALSRIREAEGRTVSEQDKTAVDLLTRTRGAQFPDDLRLPTGEFDPATGAQKTISANEYVAKAAAEAEQVKTTAEGLMRTVATCILGGI